MCRKRESTYRLYVAGLSVSECTSLVLSRATDCRISERLKDNDCIGLIAGTTADCILSDYAGVRVRDLSTCPLA